MIKKILYSVIAFMLVGSTAIVAQDSGESLTANENTDEMTTEEEPNPFPPRPKNMWEIGLQGGTSFIGGDVSPRYPVPFSGFTVGLHVRKALGYVVSLRLEANYGQTKGIDKRLANFASVNKDLDLIGLGYKKGDAFMKNYKTTYYEGALLAIFNIGNIIFHNRENNWNLYAMAGIGIMDHNTYVNALDENNNPYDFASAGFKDPGTVDNRAFNQDRFESFTDDTYETGAKGDFTQLLLYNVEDFTSNLQFGFGFSRKITDRFNIALEHKMILTGTDDLDGYTFRSGVDLSNNDDIAHQTTIQLNFNIGSKERLVEPLYWVNPLVAPMEDIAALKARPVLDLTDADDDGVLDMFDDEPDTPEGVAVDVKGVALDTDGDGIPDHQDKEMFSPSGADVDKNGVAILDDPYMTESQVKDLIDNRIESAKVSWFLPMIHFDLDKYYIKPEFVPALAHVAQVAKKNPNIRILVRGYADNRADNDYNDVLSYNRATAAINYLVENFNVPRNRLVLQYGGENSPLIPGVPDNHNLSSREKYMQYMNRRVEFSVASPGDKNMPRPDGPEAGSGTPSGNNYSGNRGSGY